MAKLKMGMIGGGMGSFIGAIHRNAAFLDNKIELVAGCFSSSFENSLQTGKDLYLDMERVYKTFEEMLSIESSLSKSDRIDFVSIVTPNHLHFDPAIMALEKGFPVIIDKPLSFTSIESNKLQRKVEETGLPFAVTHTYTGYPMVKEAKYLINSGKIGKLRKVAVEYPQGWLSTRLESTDNKKDSWRTDPKKSGKA